MLKSEVREELAKVWQTLPSTRPVFYETAALNFRAGRELSVHGFLTRNSEQGNPALGSLLLAVNNKRKFVSESLVQHYAHQLRKSYGSLNASELNQLAPGTRGG